MNRFLRHALSAPADPAPSSAGGGQGGPPPAAPPATPPGGGSPPPADPPKPPNAGDPPPAAPPADPPKPPNARDTPPAAPPADPPKEKDPWYSSLPDDWREQAAGEDEATLNTLKRYNTPQDVIKAMREAQEKIHKGEVSTGLPENPTDEQLAEFRKANGVPETPDKYELNLGEGLVLGDDDKETFKGVFEALHAANVPSEAASQVVNNYLKSQEQQAQHIQEQHALDNQNTTATLKDQWGPDYQANMNMVRGLLNEALPAEVREQFEGAVLPNGKAVFNSPEILNALSGIARKVNPAATLVPADGNEAKHLESRLGELKGKMGTDEWFQHPEWQKEYQQLLDAKRTMDSQRKSQ